MAFQLRDLLATTLLWTIVLHNVDCDGEAGNSTGCPEQYRPFKTKCYRIYSNFAGGVEKRTFQQAKDYCQNDGANLASIHNKEEQDFLTAYLGEPSVNNIAWIGLEKVTYSSPKWIDGSGNADFENYAPGEPNGGSGEKCFHLQTASTVAGMWNDVGCSTKMGFICQTPRTGNDSQEAQFRQDSRCPNGFSYYNDACYKLEENEADFWSAESVCENDYGGHLASIRDQYEEAFVSSLAVDVEENFWIGFSDHLNDLIKGKFAWTDGSHVYHTNWRSGEEPTEAATDRCVAKSPWESSGRSGWMVENCAEKLKFVCSKRLNDNNNLAEIHLGTCPEGWIDVHNQYCYYLERHNDRSYTSAGIDCARKAPGGTLAMFESAHDMLLLRPELSKDITKEMMVGIKQVITGSGTFKFSNGKTPAYLPWAVGEPNQLHWEGCVELNVRTLQYNNFACGRDSYYICQTNKVVHQRIRNGRYPNATAVVTVTGTTQGGQTSDQTVQTTPTTSPSTTTTSAKDTSPPKRAPEMTTSSARTITPEANSDITSSINSRFVDNKDMAHRVSGDSDKEDEGSGLGRETVALIGAGVVLVTLGLISTAYFVYRRRRLYEKPNDERMIRFTNEPE